MEFTTPFFIAFLVIVILIDVVGYIILRSLGQISRKRVFVMLGSSTLLLIAGGFVYFNGQADRSQLIEFLQQTEKCTVQIRSVAEDGDEPGEILCEIEIPSDDLRALEMAVAQSESISLNHRHGIDGIRFEFVDENGIRCASFLTYFRSCSKNLPTDEPLEIVSIGSAEGNYGTTYDPAAFGNLLNKLLENTKCESKL